MPPRRPAPPVDPDLPWRRARGALLGLAVGDALGTTLEFKQLPAPDFPTLADGPHTDIKGGGPFSVARGQVTDDTQLAVCLATSLLELGAFDATDVARRYRQWLPLAFDVGTLTREALSEQEAGDSQALAARRAWLRSGRKSAGNGSLMRTAPLGVFYSAPAHREARVEASLRESALTHADPRCQLACAAFNGALAACIEGGGGLSPEEVVRAAERELPVAAALAGRLLPEEELPHLRFAQEELAADLAAARQPDPLLYGPDLHLHRMQGFVRVAFRLAFWELLHAPSAEAALVDVVNRGGDADTNGAITGALLGAFWGEEALPERWRTAVLEALQGSPRSPWWERYHPRLLLPLAEAQPR